MTFFKVSRQILCLRVTQMLSTDNTTDYITPCTCVRSNKSSYAHDIDLQPFEMDVGIPFNEIIDSSCSSLRITFNRTDNIGLSQ